MGTHCNVFLLEFEKEEDVEAILQKGPWSFGNRLLAMAKLKLGASASTLSLNHADF